MRGGGGGGGVSSRFWKSWKVLEFHFGNLQAMEVQEKLTFFARGSGKVLETLNKTLMTKLFIISSGKQSRLQVTC